MPDNRQKELFFKYLLEAQKVILTSCGGDGKCLRCLLKKEGKNILFCKEPFSLTRNNVENFSPYWKNYSPPELKNKENYLFLDAGTTFWKFYSPQSKGIFHSTPSPFLTFGSDIITLEKNKSYLLNSPFLKKALYNTLKKFFPLPTYIMGNTTVSSYFELFTSNIPYLKTLPTLSPLLGSDALLMATGLEEGEIGIDAGTNCEICYRTKNGYYFTSAPTGPAFEGGNIKYGLPAIDGAIIEWKNEEGKIKIATIENKLPSGITGSGILSVIYHLLIHNLLQPDGYFPSEKFPVFQSPAKKIYLYQEDIREIQKAIAALKSALLLLKKLNPTSRLKKIKLIGNFFRLSQTKYLQQTGILPTNISLEFFNPVIGVLDMEITSLEKLLLAIKNQAHIIELSGNKDFEELFFKTMNFSPYQI